MLLLFLPAIFSGCVKSFAQITLKNNSGQAIKRVILVPERGEVLVQKNILKGSFAVFRLPVGGESSYKLKVQLEDGKVLEGGAGYVESGYRILETVTDQKIDSRYQSL